MDAHRKEAVLSKLAAKKGRDLSKIRSYEGVKSPRLAKMREAVKGPLGKMKGHLRGKKGILAAALAAVLAGAAISRK